MKKGRIIGAILALIMLIGLIAVPSAAVANGSVEVLMGICLDSSGSINSSEWDIMIDGLVNILNDDTVVPKDGSIEICVVYFGRYAVEAVPPTVVTSATVGGIVTTIQNINRSLCYTGNTNIGAGINECVASMQSDTTTYNDPDVWKVINLASDGEPNYPYSPGGKPYAEDAVTAAIGAGIQELDAEGIGISTSNCNWLAEDIVIPDGPGGNKGPIIGSPYTGTYPPRYPDPGFMGFVRYCTDFADYEEALREKLVLILKGQLYLEPDQDTNDLNTETQHCVTATLNDGYGQPVVGENVTFTVTGANSAGPTNVETDINGEAEFCYPGTNVGIDTIVATATDPQDAQKTLESDPAYKEWFRGEEPPPPIEVGGDVSPVNKISLLIPWIGLAVIAAAVAGVTLVLKRRRI